MADVTNNATVTDSQGFGPRTQIINMAKTNITKAEMQTASTFLQEAGYTITGVAGMLADETADNVKIALQGGITYVADASDAIGVTGAATTVLADFDQ
jgi:hypothetical protein